MVQRNVIYFLSHIFALCTSQKPLHLQESRAVVLDFNTYVCLCAMLTGQWYPSKFDIADSSNPTPLP